MRLRHVARQRQHQRDRVLRRRDDVRLRRIRHHDPALGRRRHVDVVDADPRTPDHAQLVGALDQLGVQPRRRADQDPVVATDPLRELLARPARLPHRPRSAHAADPHRNRRSAPRPGPCRTPTARAQANPTARCHAAGHRRGRMQRDPRGERHAVGEAHELVVAHDHRQQDRRLEHREVLADAGARPRAEREVGVAVARRLRLGREALGVESLRRRPRSRDGGA